jgi:hypothetical protein
MDKYIVNVHINKVDEKGKLTSENFDYEFESKPQELIEARRNAIKKVKDLFDFFENDLPKNEFSTVEEAEKKSYKGFNSYSISIILSTENEPYTQIYGNDDDEKLDWLEYEYQHYTNTHNIVKVMHIQSDTENFEIIEEDFTFMMG